MPRGITVFKTSALNHSAISPCGLNIDIISNPLHPVKHFLSHFSIPAETALLPAIPAAPVVRAARGVIPPAARHPHDQLGSARRKSASTPVRTAASALSIAPTAERRNHCFRARIVPARSLHAPDPRFFLGSGAAQPRISGRRCAGSPRCPRWSSGRRRRWSGRRDWSSWSWRRGRECPRSGRRAP